MAIETKNYQIETAARNIINAHNAYEKAADSYDDISDNLKDIKKVRDEAKKELDALPASVEQSAEYLGVQQAQAAYDAAAALLDAHVDDPELTEEENAAKRDDLQADLDRAQADLADAQAKLDALDLDASRALLKGAYDEADAAYNTLKSSLNTAENAVDSAWNALQQAQATYDYTVASQESNFRGSKDAVKSAEAGAGVATIQQESNVDNLNKQIEKGAVTADIGGTVTAVNIKEGERYAGGAIITIQDTDALVVSAEIDEYDIADVAIGMKAVFKTDSTRDEQLTGEVIFISPTPTMGSDVTYQVKVRIDSDTTRLRIGMNAKLNIILEETADVLTVPYDAIQQDENGNDVIYAVERGEKDAVTKTAIPVTVGVEGDYYVEVSGNITEGMEISLPTDKFFDLAAIEEEMMASMGG